MKSNHHRDTHWDSAKNEKCQGGHNCRDKRRVKNQSEMKNTVTEIWNRLDVMNTRMEEEKWINDI